jgi:hypothetical protein
MKRHPAVKILIIAGVCLIGFLVFQSAKPVSQNAIPPEKNETSKTATVADSQSQAPSAAAFIQKPALTESPQQPSQAPRQNWHEQLSALHGIGKLFGAGGEERMRQLQDFVESLDAASVPAAVKELQELQAQNPTETGRDLRLRLLRKWGNSDIRSAADWAIQMPAGSDREEAITTMAGEWSGQNFSDAAAWAGSLSDPAEKQGALASVADAAVYTDPKAALTLASTLDASSARDDVIMRAAGIWASTAPNDAVAWAKQIPDENLRQQAIASIAINWGNTDPVAAGTLAVESLEPGPVQNMAVIAVVQRWRQTDVAGVTDWVNQFPEGNLRQTATAMLDSLAKGGHPVSLNMNNNPANP